MTTYRTGNPLGSSKPKDLYDNAENLDVAVNSQTAEAWEDRLGKQRKTFHGMEAEFGRFLEGSGYEYIGEYAPGLVISRPLQYFLKDGQAYAPAAATVLPYTTTGDWATEQASFVLRGDDTLRQDFEAWQQELAGPGGAAMVGFSGGSVSAFLDLLAMNLWSDQSTESLSDFANRAEADTLNIAESTYSLNSGVTITNKNLRAINGNNSVFDFSNSTSGGLIIEGELLEITAPASVTAGAQEIVVQAALQSGDVLVIWNPSPGSLNNFRTYYHDGFMAEVFEYNAITNVAKITSSVPDGNYSNLRAFVIRDGSLDIKGLTIIPPKNGGTGLTVRYRKGVNIHSDVSFLDADAYAGAYIDRCFNVKISANGRASHTDSYPLLIGNSQSVIVNGFIGASARHAIGLGGTGEGVALVPTRDVLINDSILSNYNTTGVGATDTHGNCINVVYDNCIIRDGISLGGSDIAYRNCQIFASPYGVALAGSEVVGGNYSLESCVVDVDGANASLGRALIYLTLQESTKRRVDFSLKNVTITGKKTAKFSLLGLRTNTESDKKASISVSGLRVTGGVSLKFCLIAEALGGVAYNWNNAHLKFDDASNTHMNDRPEAYFYKTAGGTGLPSFDIQGALWGPVTVSVPASTPYFQSASSHVFPTAFPDVPSSVVVSKKGGDFVGGSFYAFGSNYGTSQISIRGRTLEASNAVADTCTFFYKAHLLT